VLHHQLAKVRHCARVRRRSPARVEFDKGSEMQRRAAVHFHAIFRLDGRDPDQPTAIVPAPRRPRPASTPAT
jgi:hypothetical protein